MFPIKRLAKTASLLASLAIGQGGVAAAQTTTTTPQTQADSTTDPGQDQAHGDLLRSALSLDSLNSTQRSQIQALITAQAASRAALMSSHSQLLNALADAIESGRVDPATLAPQEQVVVSTVIANQPADRAAVEKLHAILTPAERVDLVDQAESRMQMHEARMGGANAQHAGWIFRTLNLTPAQKNQIDANLRLLKQPTDETAHAQMREAHQRVLEAFKGDTFVMDQVVPLKNPQMVQQSVGGIVVVAQAATPVLTPDQRAAAAATLRQWAANSQR